MIYLLVALGIGVPAALGEQPAKEQLVTLLEQFRMADQSVRDERGELEDNWRKLSQTQRENLEREINSLRWNRDLILQTAFLKAVEAYGIELPHRRGAVDP